MENFILDLSSLPELFKRMEDKIDALTAIIGKLNSPIIVPQPVTNTITIENWKSFTEGKTEIILQDGYTYLVPNYQRAVITSDLLIKALTKSKIIFGKDNYNQWIENTEDQVIFDLGVWNNKITLENIDLFTGKLIDQVEPFYRTLFLNSPLINQTGTIELINSDTNLEYGLLYSGSQHKYLTAKVINVNFEGIIFQELKAKNGGGLLSYQRNCNLKQVDPITHFEAEFVFSKKSVRANKSFFLIENKFKYFGNSANILFVDGMTFYLPGQPPVNPFEHVIRSIPENGETLYLYWDGNFLNGNITNLQAGDKIRHGGIDYTVKITDRVTGTNFEASGYSIAYNLGKPIIAPSGSIVPVTVLSSRAALLLDSKARKGYMIFKYNKHFQTNVDVDHGLDYMLASNPFGVLSYNHKEITVDWEDVNHNGFYRQSQSGVGFSNGYRMVNCIGFKDQFAPGIEIKTT